MENKMNNIGISVKPVTKSCADPKCPFHGHLRLRGRNFTGTVISDKMHNTVTVEWNRKVLVPKYERYVKKRSKVKAHNPECIAAVEGDVVKIAECRPLSKTKNFVVIENYGREKGFAEKMEAREEARVKKAKKEAADEKAKKPEEEENDSN